MDSEYQKLNVLRRFDDLLMAHRPHNITGLKRFVLEF